MKTPKFSPKTPFTHSLSYAERVKAYGPAPKGYRWLKVGEEYKKGDPFCDSASWRISGHNGVVEDRTCIIARRVPKTKIVPPAKRKIVALGKAMTDWLSKADAGEIRRRMKGSKDSIEDHNQLFDALPWMCSPQDSLDDSYWGERYDGTIKLSDDDKDYLYSFVVAARAELTRREIPPTEDEKLALKIADLETKNAELEKRIAALEGSSDGKVLTSPAQPLKSAT